MSNGNTDKDTTNPVRAANVVKKSSSRPSERDGDVGKALRTIYQKTIDETVPQEMLDLLGKLG